MTKVNIKTDYRTPIETDEVKEVLESLLNGSEKVFYLGLILNAAVKSLYLTLPNGKENYGGNEPVIGHISLDLDPSTNAPHLDLAHKIELNYMPSVTHQRFFDGPFQTILGTMNLTNSTYELGWDKDPEWDENQRGASGVQYLIPARKTLKKDTRKVMHLLGLKKQRKYRKK